MKLILILHTTGKTRTAQRALVCDMPSDEFVTALEVKTFNGDTILRFPFTLTDDGLYVRYGPPMEDDGSSDSDS